jgi:hypothetical protein
MQDTPCVALLNILKNTLLSAFYFNYLAQLERRDHHCGMACSTASQILDLSAVPLLIIMPPAKKRRLSGLSSVEANSALIQLRALRKAILEHPGEEDEGNAQDEEQYEAFERMYGDVENLITEIENSLRQSIVRSCSSSSIDSIFSSFLEAYTYSGITERFLQKKMNIKPSGERFLAFRGRDEADSPLSEDQTWTDDMLKKHLSILSETVSTDVRPSIVFKPMLH